MLSAGRHQLLLNTMEHVPTLESHLSQDLSGNVLGLLHQHLLTMQGFDSWSLMDSLRTTYRIGGWQGHCGAVLQKRPNFLQSLTQTPTLDSCSGDALSVASLPCCMRGIQNISLVDTRCVQWTYLLALAAAIATFLSRRWGEGCMEFGDTSI